MRKNQDEYSVPFHKLPVAPGDMLTFFVKLSNSPSFYGRKSLLRQVKRWLDYNNVKIV